MYTIYRDSENTQSGGNHEKIESTNNLINRVKRKISSIDEEFFVKYLT